MTWHLKDRELEIKFIAIDSGFLEKLNEACEQMDNNHDGDFPEHKRFAITLGNNNIDVIFNGSHVEKGPDYDPKIWNEYPEVTPPELKLLRFKGIDVFGNTYIGSAICVHGVLLIPSYSNTGFSQYEGCNLKVGHLESGRFRPWED